MELPEYYVKEENKVCLLGKAIYGLKQVSKAWYNRIHLELTKLGFKKCDGISYVYTKTKGSSKTIIALYVDDLFVFCNDEKETLFLKQKLTSQFLMKDLGEAENILGIRIRRENGRIFLDQENYIKEILERFGMTDWYPVSKINDG